jgi:phage-related minor tail protein
MAEFGEPIETQTIAFNADMSQFRRELNETVRLGGQFSSVFVNAFESIAVKGKSLTDVLRSMALSLSSIVVKAAFKPFGDALGNGLDALFANGFGFAKGGVLQQRMPVPFASGGIIQSPVAFPLAGGRLGIAGERGAEAIMPLARGPDGRLGVAAQGGGGVNVTFNVSTPDAESFRRSESQVAAMVARAVTLGQRNL